MKLSRHIKNLVFSFLVVFGLSSCATDEYGNKRELTDTEKGAMIGAAVGVLAGLTTKDKKKKAALYGVVGGIAGGGIGYYMDSQKKDFEKQLKDQISAGHISIQKMPNDVLLVTMTAQTAFDIDSTRIKSGFKPSMDKIAKIVNKYGKTFISVVGHTDSTGSHSYNQNLSERRASSVHDYLRQKGVIPQRLAYHGMGENNPRADNSTPQGRTLNRRVELVIEPVREADAG